MQQRLPAPWCHSCQRFCHRTSVAAAGVQAHLPLAQPLFSTDMLGSPGEGQVAGYEVAAELSQVAFSMQALEACPVGVTFGLQGTSCASRGRCWGPIACPAPGFGHQPHWQALGWGPSACPAPGRGRWPHCWLRQSGPRCAPVRCMPVRRGGLVLEKPLSSARRKDSGPCRKSHHCPLGEYPQGCC